MKNRRKLLLAEKYVRDSKSAMDLFRDPNFKMSYQTALNYFKDAQRSLSNLANPQAVSLNNTRVVGQETLVARPKARRGRPIKKFNSVSDQLRVAELAKENNFNVQEDQTSTNPNSTFVPLSFEDWIELRESPCSRKFGSLSYNELHFNILYNESNDFFVYATAIATIERTIDGVPIYAFSGNFKSTQICSSNYKCLSFYINNPEYYCTNKFKKWTNYKSVHLSRLAFNSLVVGCIITEHLFHTCTTIAKIEYIVKDNITQPIYYDSNNKEIVFNSHSYVLVGTE
jgi:hypothetical protein